MFGLDPKLGHLDVKRGARARLAFRPPEQGSSSDEAIRAGTGNAGTTTPIDFQFNPKEYSISGGANYHPPGSESAGIGQFQSTKPFTTSIEIFLDQPTMKSLNPQAPSLNEQVDMVLSAVEKVEGKDHPPVLEFSWGKRSFEALATQVAVKFSMFDTNGIPIRATCTLTLTILPASSPKQNPTSGTPKIDRAHQVVLGDSLASIANRSYGDPTMWRAIAEANDINDPAKLAYGDYLTVPVRSDAERLA